MSNPLAIRPTSTTTINAALRKRGISEEVYRGNGYFFFSDGLASEWPSSSVYVMRPEALTIGGWLMEWHRLSGRRFSPARYGDHELTILENYSGFVKNGKPATEADNEGYGPLYRQRCSCEWASSWSHERVAAMNGGKAHIRAIKKRENV